MAHPAKCSLCVPVLVCTDLAAAVAFFVEKLGFKQQFIHGSPPVYAGVYRDGSELHLATTGASPTSNRAMWRKDNQPADICFFVKNADALYAEFVARGVAMAGSPTDQSYGIRDFNVTTPDGHVLRFNQVLGEHS